MTPASRYFQKKQWEENLNSDKDLPRLFFYGEEELYTEI